MTAIRAYEMDLYRRLVDGLEEEVPGLRLYGITDRARFDARTPTAALTLEGHAPRAIAEALGREGIATWDGDFYATGLIERLGLAESGGVVRIGLTHYNTAAEIDRARSGAAGADRGGTSRSRDAAAVTRPTSSSSAAGSSATATAAFLAAAGRPRHALRADGDRRRRVRSQLGRRPASVRPGARRAVSALARRCTATSRPSCRTAFRLGDEPAGLLLRRAGGGSDRRVRPGRRLGRPLPGGPRRARRRARRCAASSRPSRRIWPPAGSRSAIPVAPASATRAYAASPSDSACAVVVGAAAALAVDGDAVAGVRRRRRVSCRPDAVVVAAGPWTPQVLGGRSVAGPDRAALGRRRRHRARPTAAPRARGDRHRDRARRRRRRLGDASTPASASAS